MSIAALNAALKILNGLAIAVTKSVTDTAGAIDAYGGDTPSGSDPRGGDGPGGGDVLHAATGGGGIADSGGARSFQSGLRMAGAVVAAAKKEIEAHVTEQSKKINETTKDIIQQLIDAVAFRDTAQAEVLTYLQDRYAQFFTQFYNGKAETIKLIGLLTRWKEAQRKGDAAEMVETERQLRAVMDVVNKLLIGYANPHSALLDLDRLLGAGAADAATKINPTNSANSTGKAG